MQMAPPYNRDFKFYTGKIKIMTLTLSGKKRPENSKPNALRRQGLIPASLYGHQGAESVSLVLDQKEAEMLLRKASVNNTMIELSVSDLPWNGKVLIKEVQNHPWKKFLYHLSFFSVAGHDKLQIALPVHLVGESIGVKQGGTIEQMLTELAVSCSAENKPDAIEIDVTNLNIGDHLQVSQIPLPEGVTAVDGQDIMVLSVIAPTVSTEAANEPA